VRKAYKIGVISPYLDGYYFGNLMYGIHLEAQARGAQVLAIQTSPDLIEKTEYRMLLAKQPVDGWINILDGVTDTFFSELNSENKPFVCIGRKHDAPQGTFITSDGYNGVKQLTRHLLEHGYRRIAFAGMLHRQLDIERRYQGYLAAVQEYGDAELEAHVLEIPNNIQEGGREGAYKLLELSMPYDAIVAATDLNALGIIEVLQQAGYRVPEDIAVCGFDDINIAVTLQPPLTTVRQDIERMGRVSGQVLFEKLEGRFRSQEAVLVDTEPVIRRSCGCAFDPDEARVLANERELHSFMQEISTSVYEMGIRVRYSLISVTSDRDESLQWLSATHFHSGVLAVWTRSDCRELTIKEVFGTRLPASLVGRTLAAEQFPSAEVIGAYTIGEDVLTLHLLQTSDRQIGVLALIGPIEKHRITFGYDYIRTCFNLLASTMERRALAQELKRSEAKYRDYFNHTPVMIAVTDPQMRILDVNPFFLEQMGYTGDEVVGRSFLQLLTAASRAAFEQSVLQELGTERFVDNLELQLVQADGSLMEGLVNSRMIEEADQGPSHVYVTVRNITQRKQYEEQIKSYAFTDSLTGLANRLGMDGFLQEAMRKADEQGTQIAVLFIDLDKFKQVNDTYGHEVGDRLLQHVAEALQGQVSANDLAARLGGDEFILAFPDVKGMEQARAIGDHVAQALRKPLLLQDMSMSIQASVGISLYPEDGTSAEELLKKADLAMYHVKLANQTSRH